MPDNKDVNRPDEKNEKADVPMMSFGWANTRVVRKKDERGEFTALNAVSRSC